MSGEHTGHDFFHVDRVSKTALEIAKKETGVDLFLIQAAALLHDLGDYKVNNTKKSEEEILKDACNDLKIPSDYSFKILEIILNMSYSKNIKSRQKLSLEGKIVQDADRLDSIGAIGIARAFAFGGSRKRELYNPEIKPKTYTSLEEYRNSENPTLNHFYEKLFFLKDLMNTETGKKMATKRDKVMKNFLSEFDAEWNGKS